MLKVLEEIRQNEFGNARKRLLDLEKQFMDLPEILVSRTLYNRACVESAYAEEFPKGDEKHALALEEATRYLERWLKNGLAGAWAREGKTEQLEIHRMGSDNRACVESAYAEEFPKGDEKHALALEEATRYLERCHASLQTLVGVLSDSSTNMAQLVAPHMQSLRRTHSPDGTFHWPTPDNRECAKRVLPRHQPFVLYRDLPGSPDY